MLSRYCKRGEKGFTLIELLIVVAIIGILAAIAIPNLITAQRRSRYSRAAGDTKTITTQSQVVTSDNNQVPGAGGLGLVMPQALWDGTAPNGTRYMSQVTDPFAPVGTFYVWNQEDPACGGAPGVGNAVYTAHTVGADGLEDTANWCGTAVPVDDDLGNSTILGCAFGPNTGIANPC